MVHTFDAWDEWRREELRQTAGIEGMLTSLRRVWETLSTLNRMRLEHILYCQVLLSKLLPGEFFIAMLEFDPEPLREGLHSEAAAPEYEERPHLVLRAAVDRFGCYISFAHLAVCKWNKQEEYIVPEKGWWNDPDHPVNTVARLIPDKPDELLDLLRMAIGRVDMLMRGMKWF